MKEEINKLSDNLKDLFELHSDEVAENYVFLQSIGINNPEQFIAIVPELFINPNDEVREASKSIDVAKVNESPFSILDMI